MQRKPRVKYHTNHISFIRNNTLDDFINRRDVNNIEYIRFGSYISLYEWLMVHEISAEDVRYYGAEETTETREKFQEDEQVMLVHTRNGWYDFYPLCDLYFE